MDTTKQNQGEGIRLRRFETSYLFRASHELLSRIRAAAANRGITASDFIRTACEHALYKPFPTNKQERASPMMEQAPV